MKTLGTRNTDSDRAIKLAMGPFTPTEGRRQIETLAWFLQGPNFEVRLELEHLGIHGSMIVELAKHIGIRLGRLKQIIGLPLNAPLLCPEDDRRIHGPPAYAALALVEILGRAIDVCPQDRASSWDSARWFGQWIERPLPRLSDLSPSQIIRFPSGLPALLLTVYAMREEEFS